MADVLISKSNAKRYLGGSIPPSTSNTIDGEPTPPSTVIGGGEWVPYLGAKDNVDLGEYFLKASYLQLKTDIANIPTAQGAMYWDQNEETVAIILNGSTTKVGEDIFFQVKNQSGATIPKGTAVRFDGVVSASGRINIVPFIANGSNPSIYFLGVTYEAIANGADGKALFNGKIRGVNTSAFAVGDILYSSPTVAGGFTTTKPVAPNNIISVAAVLSSGANGILLIRPQIGSNINNDEGVKITTPTTGDLLQLQDSGLWENKSVSSLNLVPQSRTLTINGTVFDLSANRSWTIPVHDAVTLGTANGLSLSTQQLSLGLASSSTNGALSSTDWTTFNNKIGGSGTANYLAKFTDGGTVGDSQVFNNGTSVGIGTNTPFGAFTIKTAADSKITFLEFDSIPTIGAFTDAGSSKKLKLSGFPLIFSGLGAAGAEHARIANSGNLLINTTTDVGFRLDVNGSLRANTRVNFASLPTSATGLVRGDLWRNGTVINIVA